MLITRRPPVTLGLAALVLVSLCACHSSDNPGAPESVQATPSISGTVKVMSGSNASLSIPFNASGSAALSNLTITSGLSPLPTGWSGLTTFSCPTVNTGSGCVLNLTFEPTAATSGTLTLDYSYTDASGASHAASVSIPYQSTTSDNVVATSSVSGQVNAVVSGSAQPVAVTFDTDDGNPASSLTITTDLTALPAGWHSTDTTFTCATVSTGNGCQLPLTYQPTTAGSGTLTLSYSYTDDSGTAKTGSLSLPYAAMTNNVVGTGVSPSGQIAVVAPSGTQTVTVTFLTNDGRPATGLSVSSSDLSSLPSGWHTSSPSFSCATVTTGNGCQLTLTYQPSAAGSGTLFLSYSYTNNAGMSDQGEVEIPFVGTSHDQVTSTVSPTGQITALAASGSQPVVITFNTDDGATATNLSLSNPLSSLPGIWTSTDTTFSCANVSTGNACQLPLTFGPTAAGSGVLNIGYQYTDNAGTAQTGTVTIPYAATTHNNVTTTASPSGTVSPGIGTSQAVTVTFNSDDGNPVTNVSISALALSGLPTDWSSGASSLACATVNTGSSCQLNLTFSPQAVESGTASLGYSYTDNAGTAQTGTISINYSSIQQYTYVVDYNMGVYACPIQSSGSLGTCASVAGGTGYIGIGFNGNYVYLSNFNSGTVLICTVNTNGTFSSCQSSGASGFVMPTQMTAQGSYLYMADANSSHGIFMCTISSTNGTLSNCTTTGPSASGDDSRGVALTSNYAYVVTGNDILELCSVNGTTGALTNCASSGFQNIWTDIVLSAGRVFWPKFGAASTIESCAVDSDGSLSSCSSSVVDGSVGLESVAVTGNRAFMNLVTNGLYGCTVNTSDGTLSSCQAQSVGVSFQNLWQIAIH